MGVRYLTPISTYRDICVMHSSGDPTILLSMKPAASAPGQVDSRALLMASSLFLSMNTSGLTDRRIELIFLPTASQCCPSISSFLLYCSGLHQTSQTSACLATTRSSSFSPPPPTQIGGWGFWTGRGPSSTSVTEKYFPV